MKMGNKSTRRIIPSNILPTTNSTWPKLGSNLGRRYRKPTINLLSYGITVKVGGKCGKYSALICKMCCVQTVAKWTVSGMQIRASLGTQTSRISANERRLVSALPSVFWNTEYPNLWSVCSIGSRARKPDVGPLHVRLSSFILHDGSDVQSVSSAMDWKFIELSRMLFNFLNPG